MKLTKEMIFKATKITLVLFGILPLIAFMVFGDLPTLSVMETQVSWLEADIVLGALFFLGYLLIGSLSGNRTRLPQKKIHA